MADKLVAEWFWTDRWTQSDAFELPAQARGVYREMLTQAWRLGGHLPNDPRTIQRLCNLSGAEWTRTWPRIKKYWRAEGLMLVNDTQLEVYAEAQRRSTAATVRGSKGGHARAAQAQLKHSTGSAQAEPKLSPSSAQAEPKLKPLRSNEVLQNTEKKEEKKERTYTHPHGSGAMAGQLPRDHLRHAVCGRVCLQETQFQQFVLKLGGVPADAAVAITRWATSVLAEWDEPPKIQKSIQGTTFQWWDQRWIEFQGSPTAAVTPSWRPSSQPSWTCPHTPRCATPDVCAIVTARR